MMSAPSRANVIAWLRPWPRAAPVMKATLPSTRPVIVLSSLSLCVRCVQHVVLVLAGFRTRAGERVGAQARAGGAAGLLLVRASFATDRMIRRQSIRMICAGPPVSRRVLHNRGLPVVT